MAKVFISHSWNDNDISRRIAHELKRDGAEIWIDYARIKGREALPLRISQALEWCDTLVLMWSKSAAESYYVNLEWQAALEMKKRIVLCILDDAQRPAILRGFLYIDFKNFSKGYEQLLRALDLEAIRPPAPPAQPAKPVRPLSKLPTRQILKLAVILVAIVILGLTINYVVQKISSDRAAKEAYWNKWQTDMNTRFQQAQQSDGDTRKSASDKLKIWQQFLTDFAADNRYSQQDNAQRQTATLQQDDWSIEVQREKDQARYEMNRGYQQALQQEKQTSLPAADKANLWQDFLNQYEDKDYPYRQEDKEKLASANRKKDFWLNQVQQESEKVQREQRQAAMTRNYNEAKQQDQNPKLSPDAKAQIWQKFLIDYADDISFSQQDNDQRNYADRRKTYWTNYQPPQPRPVTPPAEKTVKGMTLVLIRGGSFDMGDTFGDGSANEKPVHSVTVSDFYMGKTEVTVAQYRNFCQAAGRQMPDAPSWGWQDNHPIVKVSWDDAVAFCQWAGCRLPREAEWEYAVREGGKKVKWSGTSTESLLDEYAWYGSNSGSQTHPVMNKKPNALGLYDMSGNVWEWCADWYGEYKSARQNDPKGPSSGTARVLRGGSWYNSPRDARSAYRHRYNPDDRNFCWGFRVVQDSPH